MKDTNKNQKIIAVLDDLFFSSKIREASKSLNLAIEFLKNTEGLLEKLKTIQPSLIIFDLNSKASNPLEAIQNLKSSPELKDITVLGYLSHVQTELKEAASEAGCDLILPRSKFSKDLRTILSKYSR